MNMKNTIKTAILSLLAAVTVNGQGVQNAKNWGPGTEFGYYEQRIDGGKVTATDSPYFKTSAEVATLRTLNIVGSVELVEDNSRDQLHASLGTVFSTPIGDIDTRLVAHKTEGSDFTFELEGQYKVSPFDLVDANLSLSVENGDGTIDYSTQLIYTPALNISKTFSSSYFDLVLGGEVGKSYGLEGGFEYIQLYTRVETLINDLAHVYVQFNWLDNDDVVYDSTTFASSENFESSIQAGVSFEF
jgi:hypothetical protein